MTQAELKVFLQSISLNIQFAQEVADIEILKANLKKIQDLLDEKQETLKDQV